MYTYSYIFLYSNIKIIQFYVIPLQFSRTYLCNRDTFHSTLYKVYELKMYTTLFLDLSDQLYAKITISFHMWILVMISSHVVESS
jgi:hypothetical protein